MSSANKKDTVASAIRSKARRNRSSGSEFPPAPTPAGDERVQDLAAMRKLSARALLGERGDASTRSAQRSDISMKTQVIGDPQGGNGGDQLLGEFESSGLRIGWN